MLAYDSSGDEWYKIQSQTRSVRFDMYKQVQARQQRKENPPALTNEDRFIQHVIKEYETKGRI